jgi:hypothetical protein
VIHAKFAPQCSLRKIETFEFKTYEEFFRFYMSHNDKGIIFGVREATND